jgi:uridine kinase
MLEEAISRIDALLPACRAPLVGISGIDSSGKGYVAKRLEEEFVRRGLRVANINVDAWLNPPAIRFSDEAPAETFYRRGLRLDEMFEQLVLPLRRDRSVRITADVIGELDDSFRREEIVWDNVDLILLEGIFLFQPRFVGHFDLRCWVECPFDVALARAIARGQEGLPPQGTIDAFERIYFPAQRLHFERDQPQTAAAVVIANG